MLPKLTRWLDGEVAWFEDANLRESAGLVVAFSERRGGISDPPFETLNLADHVGDGPRAVDENRDRFLEALGIGQMRDRLTTAQQTHGDRVSVVTAELVGWGAFSARGLEPVPATDALLTDAPRVPLMLLYADCVPVVLVAPNSSIVSVVHAGWKGALAGLPGRAAQKVASLAREGDDILAYIGAHICSEHYSVCNDRSTKFVERFGTVAAAAPGYLDLDAVVTADLSSAGVELESICRLGICTAEATESFFSYRSSSGTTGRHAAVAAILG